MTDKKLESCPIDLDNQYLASGVFFSADLNTSLLCICGELLRLYSENNEVPSIEITDVILDLIKKINHFENITN